MFPFFNNLISPFESPELTPKLTTKRINILLLADDGVILRVNPEIS